MSRTLMMPSLLSYGGAALAKLTRPAIAAMLMFVASASCLGQVVYLPFNGDTADASGNGNDGMLNGPAALSADGAGWTGQAGDQSLDLGEFGNEAHVTLPSAASGALNSLAANDKATIAFWAYGNDEQPVSQWTFRAGGPESDRVLGSHAPWGDGNLYFDVAGCCGPNTRISAALPEEDTKNSWNHLAYVKDGPASAVYVNGSLFVDSGMDAKDPITEINEFSLGGDFNGGSSYSGRLDDFAVWDQALTPANIRALAGGANPLLVPEPSSILLAVVACLAVLAVARRRCR